MWWLIETMKTDRCENGRSKCDKDKVSCHRTRVTMSVFQIGGIGLLLVLPFLFSSTFADLSQQKECGRSEVRCLCGIPRCLDQRLVNNGVQDCQDASDEEGQWDPTKCRKNMTTAQAATRKKRAAISEILRVTNGGATTTFFEGERGRTRPIGLLTTSMGSFQVSGTTTEYITKLLATYIKGTYARILTTTSRIYHALSTVSNLAESIHPTGFIASTVSTEINGYATTIHTTDFYRTYIDNTYAQQISAYSNVYYPPWYTDRIVPSVTSDSSEDESNIIYPTPTYNPSTDFQTQETIQFVNNGQFGRVVINPILPIPPMAKQVFPERVEGQFQSVNNYGTPTIAELGVLDVENGPASFRLKDDEVQVVGTHGNFVHKDPIAGDTTYNVFTGTYIQNSKTFLFFFGNTALSPSSVGHEMEQQTILVENGPQKDRLLVDMSQRLKLIVPGTKERTTIESTLNGQPVEGVMVEIEGSEIVPDDLVSVEGATPTIEPMPEDPRIQAVTITLDKNIREVISKPKATPLAPVIGPEEDWNEIPTGRAAQPALLKGNPLAQSQIHIQPTKVSNRMLSLPTYTVGRRDIEAPRNYYEATTNSDEDITFNVESSTNSNLGKDQILKGGGKQPVFQRPQNPRRTFTPGRNQQGQPGSFSRKPKTFMEIREVENDLMSAASNRHATVTYVGFADFTTTVGNTVIVFMPRTRMLEDLIIEASKTEAPRVDPTRYTYTTEEEPPVTTPKKQPEPIVDEIIEITTPKPPPPPPRPKYSKKTIEPTSTSLSTPETTVLVSGRQTLFSDFDVTETTLPSSSITFSTQTFSNIERKSSFSLKPKAQLQSTTINQVHEAIKSVTPVSTQTTLYEVDEVNPTGVVSSISGSIVRDSTTTLYTSLIIGTYIDGSYAQVIKSTSTVFYLVPSKTVEMTPLFIQPTPIPEFSSTFPSVSPSKSIPPPPRSVVTYEVTTTNSDDEETTTTTFDRAEIRVTSSTTESGITLAEEEETTTNAGSIEEEKTTVSLPINPNKNELDEALNEIERARKVIGRPQEQIIIEEKEKEKEGTSIEKPTTEKVSEEEVQVTPSEEEVPPEVDQTIYVTKTVPTTVFRTYTYFTTYFIPKEDHTISSVISREVTSTAVGFVKKTMSSIIPASTSTSTSQIVKPTVTSSSPIPDTEEGDLEDEDYESPLTFYKTYFTTFTYLTTFFTGETSSVSSREEVISSVSTIMQAPSPSAPIQVIHTLPPMEEVIESENLLKEDENPNSQFPSIVEETILKTFFTTYTYFSTFFNGLEATTRSRIEVIKNIVPTTIRSTILPSTTEPLIRPTAATGRKVSTASDLPEDQNEVGTHLSEASEASTQQEPINDYYELESSEMTTDRSVYNELELEDDAGKDATPALKTLFTTFSFFTTYYKGGSSTVATRLQTITNIVSELPAELTESDQLPVFPITYLTTFTYWTTHFKDKSTLVTSREETISNVVTPGVDDLSPSPTMTMPVDVQATQALQRIPKRIGVEPTEDSDFELTTYFTTYTYFTSSYIGDETIVNSRLETITNVVTGTPVPPSIPPSSTVEQYAPRAIGTMSPEQELIEHDNLPVGLLSTVTNREVVDRTTTEYLTDVYGTYIDGIYAQVLESTSRIILPTSHAQTKFLVDATNTPLGLLNVNEGKTVEGDGAATTFYRTETSGTVANGQYAQVISSSYSVTGIPNREERKTGLVRVIDGSLVEGDKTTFYTSSIFGTIIDGQYGQIIESTTKFVISPTATESFPTSIIPTQAILQSSEVSTESDEIPTTTEGLTDEKIPKRFPGRGKDRGRISFNPPISKSFTPFITPFASRSRPIFAPKRKSASSAVIVTREDVTPTVTATLAPATSRTPLQQRPRFRRPESEQSTTSSAPVVPTPRLSSTPARSRFQRPGNQSEKPILPTTSSGVIKSSSNSFQRGPSSRKLSPSIVPSRTSGFSTRPVSSTNRFLLKARGSLAPSRASSSSTNPSVTQIQTIPPPLKEEEIEEPSSTTEPTKTSTNSNNRFGNNRFRLNPKLNVQNLLTTTTTERTTTAPRVRKTFTRPTIPTRGITSTTEEQKEEEVIETEEAEQEVESSQPPSTTTTTTTQKPSLRSLIASRRPTGGANRQTSQNVRQATRQTTTTLPPSPRTTTRRSFAPRTRPLGFPSRGLVRGSSTERNEEAELDFDESKNLPGNVNLEAAASAPNSNSIVNGAIEEKEVIPKVAGLLSDVLGIDEGTDLVDSGSEFFETIQSPYESYEVEMDEGSSRSGVRDDLYSLAPRRITRQVNYGARQIPEILRSNFRRGGKAYEALSTTNAPLISSSDTDSISYKLDNQSDADEYYYDDPPPQPITPKPTTPRSSTRFRGRITHTISPSPSSPRHTPFTLTNTNSRTTRPTSSSSTLLLSRRSQSRYKPPEVTTPSSYRTTSRFRSNRNQPTTTLKPKSRFTSPVRNRAPQPTYEEPYYEKEADKPRDILTVTHFLPSETTIPLVNGKLTEYKTILIPSASIEILSPYQYTYSLHNGREIRVINSEVTSTPSFGFGGEVTKFLIKEIPTTSITFTPTTIRGRRTSFSHVLSTYYYTVEPTVSTFSPLNTLPSHHDANNQLTQLLLSQLLGNLNFAGLQQQQQQLPQHQQQLLPGEVPTPVTQFSTKTTTYVTTITDFTSTVIPITLHGKAIKTTIVESQVNVLTATEFITESTVITPMASFQGVLSTMQGLLPQGINPAILQGLLQQQLNQFQIQPTQMQKLEEATETVVTIFVSGKIPGEFSTVLSTLNGDGDGFGRKKRFIDPSPAQWIEVKRTAAVGIKDKGGVELEDSYSFTEGVPYLSQSQNQDLFQPIRTQSLDSQSVPYG